MLDTLYAGIGHLVRKYNANTSDMAVYIRKDTWYDLLDTQGTMDLSKGTIFGITCYQVDNANHPEFKVTMS